MANTTPSTAPALYVVLEKTGRDCIWSQKYEKNFFPGETIDLSHATSEQIAALVAAKEIALKAATAETKKEVSNG